MTLVMEIKKPQAGWNGRVAERVFHIVKKEFLDERARFGETMCGKVLPLRASDTTYLTGYEHCADCNRAWASRYRR